MRRIFSAAELQSIRCKENGEPLIDLEAHPEIRCDYRRTDTNFSKVLVRETVAKKLLQVQWQLSQLDKNLQLLVVEGYRSPTYQEQYFLNQLLEEYQKYTNLDFADLIEHVHGYVALPSVAGHPTGGAVDLTIAYEGLEMDMGGAIADFSQPVQLPTYSTDVSTKQRERRLLLHDIMVAQGFAPFYGEWWHFSYGDREWAATNEILKAHYSPIMV